MKFTLLTLISFLCYSSLHAQNMTQNAIPIKPKMVTLSAGIEGNIIQFSKVTVGNIAYSTIPRYTYFFNSGIDINFKIKKQLTLFTGFQLKNIGIITKYNDSLKTKERVYTIGAPAGIKLFSRDKKIMFKTGADIGLAFNYKWKRYEFNKKVAKGNEFFSNKSNLMLASVFAGFEYAGLSLTANYYLTNFYNATITTKEGQIFTIGIGVHLDSDWVKSQQSKSKAKNTVAYLK